MGTQLFSLWLDGAVSQTGCYPWEYFLSPPDLSPLCQRRVKSAASAHGSRKAGYLLPRTRPTSRSADITARFKEVNKRTKDKSSTQTLDAELERLEDLMRAHTHTHTERKVV